MYVVYRLDRALIQSHTLFFERYAATSVHHLTKPVLLLRGFFQFLTTNRKILHLNLLVHVLHVLEGIVRWINHWLQRQLLLTLLVVEAEFVDVVVNNLY